LAGDDPRPVCKVVEVEWITVRRIREFAVVKRHDRAVDSQRVDANGAHQHFFLFELAFEPLPEQPPPWAIERFYLDLYHDDVFAVDRAVRPFPDASCRRMLVRGHAAEAVCQRHPDAREQRVADRLPIVVAGR
jgi:hypothetical protein